MFFIGAADRIRVPDWQGVEARNDSLPSCEGMMCRNLSCQNDRHISLYRNQKRELEVTESAGMGPFLKKVAVAFPGRNFQKRI